MKHFKINSPDDPEPVEESHLYDIGTYVPFLKQVSESFSVTVRFA